MKKNILLLAMSAALFTTSCSDFLDVQPEGNATTTTYFTNDQQAIDAVDALYERFHQETLYVVNCFGSKGQLAMLYGAEAVAIIHWRH